MRPSELRRAARKHGMRFVVQEYGGVAFYRDLARTEFRDEDADKLTGEDLAAIAKELDRVSETLRNSQPASPPK